MIKDYIKNILLTPWWYFYAKSISNLKLPTDPKSILFICQGNVCRSPFAEHLAKGKFSRNKIEFMSAGLDVKQANRPPDQAINAAQKFGVDLSTHRSRQVDIDMIKGVDMVMGMEPKQLYHLHLFSKEYKTKYFLLPLFENNEALKTNAFPRYHIKDPYGAEEQDFKQCFTHIDSSLNNMFYKLS